jgi:hypothetical protein
MTTQQHRALIRDDPWIRHAWLEFRGMRHAVRDRLITLTQEDFLTMTMEEFGALVERAEAVDPKSQP